MWGNRLASELRFRWIRTGITVAMLATCVAIASCDTARTRVLFVGNSITYTGNLPAVFEALCATSGRSCTAEMIAEGGATLKQRVDDQTLSKALSGHRFDYLVLQERGGDYIATPPQQEVKLQAEAAAEALVTDARERGLKPVLLGTYQGYSAPSEQLVAAEIAVASRLEVPVVSISNRFVCARDRFPALRWLDSDGLHPGPELTLLMAVLLYRELFEELPADAAIDVRAPTYGPRNSPRASSFASSQSIPSGAASVVSYDRSTVHSVVRAAGGAPCP